MVPRSVSPLLLALCVVLAGCGSTGDPGPTPTVGVPPSGPATTAEGPQPNTRSPQTTAAPTPSGPGSGGHFRRYAFEATTVSETRVVREVALTREDVERTFSWRKRPFLDDLLGNHSAERFVVEVGNHDGLPGHLEDGDTVRLNGTYYRLNKTVVGERSGPAYRMHLEGPMRERFHEDYDRAEEEAVDLASLSDLDRRIFTYAVPAPDEREGSVHSAGYFWVFTPNASREDATLADGERRYVRYEGDYYRFEGGERRGDGVRYRVRYDLAPVAPSAAAFADEHLETFVTPITEESLQSPARNVILEALRNSSVAWEGETEAPERYAAAARWIQDRPPDGGLAYARYDGALYRLTVVRVME